MSSLCVLIGRFQPPHEAHVALVRNARKKADHVLVLVGSVNAPRTPKNPFSYEERVAFFEALLGKDAERVSFRPLDDSPCDDAWRLRVVATVDGFKAARGFEAVRITGFEKDVSSQYLQWFPEWEPLPVAPILGKDGLINATDRRARFFSEIPSDHEPMAAMLAAWKTQNPALFCGIVAEKLAEEKSRTRLEEAALALGWPVALPTVDAVVFSRGKVLMVQRKNAPGAGLWALPGGFVDRGETSRQAVLRELAEETGIVLPPSAIIGQRVFDAPGRSPRGWIRTESFFFVLDAPVDAVSDGKETRQCAWISMLDLDRSTIFEDHHDIITFWAQTA